MLEWDGENADYTVWISKLRAELVQYEILDTIDELVPTPTGLTKMELEYRQTIAQKMIIGRLDKHHVKQVYQLTNPKRIIERLSTLRDTRTTSQARQIQRELTSMVYEPLKESAADFIWK